MLQVVPKRLDRAGLAVYITNTTQRKSRRLYTDIYNDSVKSMASKTIMIQESTYNKLLLLKSGGESFNDVILRLISQQQDLMKYAGLLSEKEADMLENVFDDIERANDAADSARDLGD